MAGRVAILLVGAVLILGCGSDTSDESSTTPSDKVALEAPPGDRARATAEDRTRARDRRDRSEGPRENTDGRGSRESNDLRHGGGDDRGGVASGVGQSPGGHKPSDDAAAADLQEQAEHGKDGGTGGGGDAEEAQERAEEQAAPGSSNGSMNDPAAAAQERAEEQTSR